jgi:hypothetical protein
MGIKSGARWSADPEVDEAVIVPFAAVRTLEKISESCETIFDASHLTEMKRMNVSVTVILGVCQSSENAP